MNIKRDDDYVSVEFENDEEFEAFQELLDCALEEEVEEIIDLYSDTIRKLTKSIDNRSIDLDKEITKVTFSDPATIVFWSDGTKTVTKCSHGDTFNKETGLAMCIIRKLCGNRNYNKVFEKYCK